MSTKKILFISHNATLSGAPLYLLNFLKWLKTNSNLQVNILLISGGELQNSFSQIAPTYIWEGAHSSNNLLVKVAGKISVATKITFYQKSIIKALQLFNPQLIYGNTIATSQVGSMLASKLQCNAVLHVHEMAFSIHQFYASFLQAQYLQNFKHFIVVNSFIKSFLKVNAINDTAIKVLPPFFTPAHTTAVFNANAILNIGFVGSANWQKGFDVLPLLIATIKYNYNINNFIFTWVGNIDEAAKLQLLFEMQQINCVDKIIFAGKLNNPATIYEQFDVMCLLSKEDSFPISCLELASMGKPIICFDKAGGMANFVQHNVTGFVVPFLDINTLCSKFNFLQANPLQLQQMGIAAHNSVKQYAINIQAPLLLEHINTILQ